MLQLLPKTLTADTLPTPYINAFTVDVEDYFHVGAFADRISTSSWHAYESRVVGNTQRILDLLQEFQVRGTFFVLGWVADQHPELVQQIHEAGHEIGCHSYWHRLVYSLSPRQFRDDLLRSTRAIESITGRRPAMFRAPSFSITQEALWALDILAGEGYQIDSSIYPIQHDVYGLPGAEPGVHQLNTDSGQIWEVPPTVRCFRRFRLPVGGGGYLRLYPSRMSIHCLEGVNAREQRPFVLYVHPWELDPQQPRLAGRWKSRWRHYQNLHTTEPKLRSLLRRFRFGPLSQIVDERERTGATEGFHLNRECGEGLEIGENAESCRTTGGLRVE